MRLSLAPGLLFLSSYSRQEEYDAALSSGETQAFPKSLELDPYPAKLYVHTGHLPSGLGIGRSMLIIKI
jgi:hypothetical protein